MTKAALAETANEPVWHPVRLSLSPGDVAAARRASLVASHLDERESFTEESNPIRFEQLRTGDLRFDSRTGHAVLQPG
jgi:hypothetical protein